MVSDPAPLPDLTRRDTFRHWARIPIRYNDLDTLGHVNNAATSVYLEQARCELLYPLIGAERKPEIDLVMARLIIDYRRELTFPGVIEVGTSVVRQGTKSFHLAHGIFRAGTDDCVSTGESILVWYSLAHRVSMVPPDDIRAAMAGFSIR
ncbi:MAG: acyl-CoA thioesterase [Hyphomicrobiaceae bacterium]|jgi:acyl-CoA thioester hydrolase